MSKNHFSLKIENSILEFGHYWQSLWHFISSKKGIFELLQRIFQLKISIIILSIWRITLFKNIH